MKKLWLVFVMCFASCDPHSYLTVVNESNKPVSFSLSRDTLVSYKDYRMPNDCVPVGGSYVLYCAEKSWGIFAKTTINKKINIVTVPCDTLMQHGLKAIAYNLIVVDPPKNSRKTIIIK